jgi:predicted metal-dependent hydrolase
VSLFGPRLRAGDCIDAAGSKVVLKVNRRARRVSLRIDCVRGFAVAVAPSERRLAEAAAFARERAAWIAERLAAGPEPTPFAPGAVIPFRGERARLEAIAGSSAARLVCGDDGVRIVSGGEGAAFSRRIERFLRAEARRAVEARTEAHVRTLGLKPPRVSIADPGSRWGSCTPSRGTIRYSWRLILAPDSVLDYVAAHETAHLVHGDHSQRFWAVVRSLVGDEKAARRWLRTHGSALHAVGRD